MADSLSRPTRLVASTDHDYDYNSLDDNDRDARSEIENRSVIVTESDSDTDTDSETGSDSETAPDSETESEASSTAAYTLKSQDSGNFRSLTWSADGTSLITTGADRIVRIFILPPNLLESPAVNSEDENSANHHHLDPYSCHIQPTPIYATALSPNYNLNTPETTLILTSISALPIRLISPFAPGILATYPLVNPSTEKWMAPLSLVFSNPEYNPDSGYSQEQYASPTSLRFLAGSQNQIAVFDVSRDGAGPMTVLPTAPGNRKARRGGSTGMAGLVSTMALSCEGILAAGTFSRGLGLYDSQGLGDTIGTWSLTGTEDGTGITSLHWSRCGKYLSAAERGSDGIGVWDIRGTGKRLAWLSGRTAKTSQRLGIALGQNLTPEGGEDLYAGGTDGVVRVWNKIGAREGVLECDWQWQAHGDAVSGIGVHFCGSVIATCSGSRQSSIAELAADESDSECSQPEVERVDGVLETTKLRDNSVRVWSLDQLAGHVLQDD